MEQKHVMKWGKIITNLSRGLVKIDAHLTKLCTCMFLLLALHFYSNFRSVTVKLSCIHINCVSSTGYNRIFCKKHGE
jgi:hypothetical protein